MINQVGFPLFPLPPPPQLEAISQFKKTLNLPFPGDVELQDNSLFASSNNSYVSIARHEPTIGMYLTFKFMKMCSFH